MLRLIDIKSDMMCVDRPGEAGSTVHCDLSALRVHLQGGASEIQEMIKVRPSQRALLSGLEYSVT